jgi:hypothetical protein
MKDAEQATVAAFHSRQNHLHAFIAVSNLTTNTRHQYRPLDRSPHRLTQNARRHIQQGVIMALTKWNPIPIYTARHNSKIRRQNEPYRIHNIESYLVNPIGWEIHAENADPQDPHLTEISKEVNLCQN